MHSTHHADPQNLLALAVAVLRLLAAILEPIPPDTLMFPISVYEKCADRIGMLGTAEAAGVVRFYGMLSGFRMGVRLALSDLPMEGRIRSLDQPAGKAASDRVAEGGDIAGEAASRGGPVVASIFVTVPASLPACVQPQ